LQKATFEVCGKRPARRNDVLRVECSHDYRILVDLLYKHPELAKEDFELIREIFDWRTKKILASAEARA